MNRLPDLEAWAIFAKVAELGSFARAAEALSLSQATVSKSISRLEARMNTTLFHRTSRRMSLTDSGLGALERATRILEEGEAVEADITEQSGTLRGRIRLSAPMSFGLSNLAPLLPTFMDAHPGIELDIQFNDQQVDLVAERFDLAVRIANLDDSSLLARRLCQVRILLVGSPRYFERHGRPRHPKDLVRHRTLHYSLSRSGSNWRFRHPQQGEFAQGIQAQLQVNNADALTPALLAGCGIALQPEFMVWQQLRAGTLESVMEDWETTPIGVHLVTPPGRRRPQRVQALIDYLATRIVQAPWVHGSR